MESVNGKYKNIAFLFCREVTDRKPLACNWVLIVISSPLLSGWYSSRLEEVEIFHELETEYFESFLFCFEWQESGRGYQRSGNVVKWNEMCFVQVIDILRLPACSLPMVEERGRMAGVWKCGECIVSYLWIIILESRLHQRLAATRINLRGKFLANSINELRRDGDGR